MRPGPRRSGRSRRRNQSRHTVPVGQPGGGHTASPRLAHVRTVHAPMSDTKTPPSPLRTPRRRHVTGDHQVVVIGAGPAGLTAAYQLHKHGVAVDDPRGRRHGRRHQPHRRARRLALRHRRPPLLHQGEARSRTSGTRSSPTRTSCMRPRMSRIFYDGKYFDYPLKAFNALRNLGPVEAVLCVGSYVWARDPPAEGPDQLRGLARRPLRLAPLPHLLQDLHREGVGRAGQRDARRLGRPADQEPVARQRHHQRAAAQAEPEGHHLAHRGVPVPQVRARDDVGGLPRQGRGPGLQGRHGDRGHQGPPRGRPGHQRRSPTRRRRRAPSTRPPTSSRRCRSRSCSRPWTRRCPPRSQAAADDLRYRDFLTVALVVPESRAPSPTTGSTSTTPRSACASRTSARGRRTWSRRAAPASASSTSCSRATTMWTPPDEDLIEQGKPELEQLGLVEPGDVEAGYVVRMPKAYPIYDDRYQANVDVLRALARRARRQRAPRRPQRHAPLQQPGPLDVHGDAHRREHRHRHQPRHLGGQRRGGVPRGEGPGHPGGPSSRRAATGPGAMPR